MSFWLPYPTLETLVCSRGGAAGATGNDTAGGGAGWWVWCCPAANGTAHLFEADDVHVVFADEISDGVLAYAPVVHNVPQVHRGHPQHLVTWLRAAGARSAAVCDRWRGDKDSGPEVSSDTQQAGCGREGSMQGNGKAVHTHGRGRDAATPPAGDALALGRCCCLLTRRYQGRWRRCGRPAERLKRFASWNGLRRLRGHWRRLNR